MSNSSSPRPLADPNVYYGQPIIPVVVLCLLLTTTFVALRFWSRGVILRALGIEDAFLLVAWVSMGRKPCSAAQVASALAVRLTGLSFWAWASTFRTSSVSVSTRLHPSPARADRPAMR